MFCHKAKIKAKIKYRVNNTILILVVYLYSCINLNIVYLVIVNFFSLIQSLVLTYSNKYIVWPKTNSYPNNKNTLHLNNYFKCYVNNFLIIIWL